MELIELSEEEFQPSTITLAGNFNISININNLALWMPIKIIYDEIGKRRYLLSGSRQSISYFGYEGDIVSICYKKIRRGMRTGAMNNMISADIQYNKKNIHLKISSSSITSVGTSSYENGQDVFRLMTKHIQNLKDRLDIINELSKESKQADLEWLKKKIFSQDYTCQSLANLILKEKGNNPLLLYCALFIEDEEIEKFSNGIKIKFAGESDSKEYENYQQFIKDMEESNYNLNNIICEVKYKDIHNNVYANIYHDYKNIVSLDKYKIISFYAKINYSLPDKEYYYHTLEEIINLDNYDNIIFLDCSNNQLTKLPSLPKKLQELYASNNLLKQLPPLPSNLKILRVHYNQLSELPPLPASLQEVWAFHNDLTDMESEIKFFDINKLEYNNLITNPKSREDKLMKYFQKMCLLQEDIFICDGELKCDNFIIYNSVYHITPVRNKKFRMPLHRLAPFLASEGVAVEYHNWTSEGVNICFDTEEKRDKDSHKEYKHRFSIHETTKIRQCSPTNKKEAYINYLGVIKLLHKFFSNPQVDFNKYVCEKLEDKRLEKDYTLLNGN